MTYKYKISLFFWLLMVILSSVVLTYFIFPSLFYFRAWEYFDNLVYTGYYNTSVSISESGDASRAYLNQRYTSDSHKVSVNNFGNRVACYSALRGDSRNKSVIMVGDSQLFGSGLSDEETLPKQLCNIYPDVSIYNASRRHGLGLLNNPSYSFNTIIFTSIERGGLASQYCPPSFAGAGKAPLLDDKYYEIKSIPILEFLKINLNFLFGYAQSRLALLWQPDHYISPVEPIFLARHVHTDDDVRKEVECAKKLESHYSALGYKVGFIYFPSQQTILSKFFNLEIDSMTRNYLPNIYTKFKAENLNTVDSLSCLMDGYDSASINSPSEFHDTHLSAAGISRLSKCIEHSMLAKLFSADSTH